MKRKICLFILSLVALIAGAFAVSACSKVDNMLYTPQNVAYDGQYVTWNKVELADYYYVTINGGEKARSNSTTYAYQSDDTFEVTVSSVSDGEEKASTSQTFKPLAKINEVFVSDNGEISWDAVAGANAYTVSVNGATQTVTDTRISTLPVGSNRVKVKPIVSGDNTFYSTFSQEVNVYMQYRAIRKKKV